MTDYNVGDTIEYKAFGGLSRIVVVTTRENDIKKGHPGFHGYLADHPPEDGSATVWGYDSQIVRVVKRTIPAE